jgi:hypothetical protein
MTKATIMIIKDNRDHMVMRVDLHSREPSRMVVSLLIPKASRAITIRDTPLITSMVPKGRRAINNTTEITQTMARRKGSMTTERKQLWDINNNMEGIKDSSLVDIRKVVTSAVMEEV